MAITQDDFKKVWASTSSVPEYTFSDTDYKNGWEFVGNLPPTRAMWDELQRKNDEKMQFLQENGSMCFDSVTDMKSSNLDAGQTAFTKGYYSINDGGAGTYSIRGKVAGETEDGGSVIFLDNGNVAELIITDGKANIKQFGAYGDNEHDDTDAIVACANYCSANDKILYSDNATYKTTTNCIISMVKQVELHGHFTFLELRYAHTQTNQYLQLIEMVDSLILRDYKNTTFHIGYANDVKIIADYAYKSGSSFAYCMFYGGAWHTLSLVGGATGGWINENSFFRNRIYELNIGIESSYSHNNNRFYDINLESAVVNLNAASCNFFSYRGEGGVTINTTDRSVNNIFEPTYVSSLGLYMNYTGSIKDGKILQNQWFKYLKKTEILKFDINNVTFNNNHDFSNNIATIRSWNGDGLSQSLGNATFDFTSDVVLYAYGNGQRASFVLLDENFEPVPKATEDIVRSSSFVYNSTSHYYNVTIEIPTGELRPAYIRCTPNTTVKYIRVSISQGSAATKVTSCGLFALSWIMLSVSSKQYKPVSKTKPTLTTDVPKGFEVINIGTNTAIWKWVFNGTEWVQIDYSTQA